LFPDTHGTFQWFNILKYGSIFLNMIKETARVLKNNIVAEHSYLAYLRKMPPERRHITESYLRKPFNYF